MKQSVSWSALLLAGALVAVADSPAPAAAHVCMDFPLSRAGSECIPRSPQKVGPCGVAERTDMINVFHPGETIDLVLRETVDHPSHYRIAFNPDGESFPDPATVDDVDPETPFVLVNGIEDADEAIQTVQITFPEIECENCTLQLIQVMYDKGENGFGGRTAEGGNDDMYYSCADIALRRTPVAVAPVADGFALSGFAGLGLVMVVGAVLIGVGRRDEE